MYHSTQISINRKLSCQSERLRFDGGTAQSEPCTVSCPVSSSSPQIRQRVRGRGERAVMMMMSQIPFFGTQWTQTDKPPSTYIILDHLVPFPSSIAALLAHTICITGAKQPVAIGTPIRSNPIVLHCFQQTTYTELATHTNAQEMAM